MVNTMSKYMYIVSPENLQKLSNIPMIVGFEQRPGVFENKHGVRKV